MKDFPEPIFVQAGDVRLATYQAGEGAPGRPPIILVHGWPELAYSWKNQMGPLAKAGFKVIAIDLKGFGASDAPEDKTLYDAAHITGDFVALLDALGIEKAIFCGHDWGGALVWAMGQLHPERVAGIIGVSTPLRPRPPVPPLQILAKRFTPNHYIVRFQEEDAPEKLFESDVERFFPFIFRKPAPRERWLALIPGVFDLMSRFAEGGAPKMEDVVLSKEDLQIYIDAYKKSGFRGGINIYRNVDCNWALMEGREQTIAAPSLWIGAELDLFLPPESAEGMEALIPDLEKRVLSGCGHWVMWEKPERLNAAITDWLKRRF